MDDITKFISKHKVTKRKRSKLEPFKDEIFLLRDEYKYSYEQIKIFLSDYKNINVSTKTVCIFYNKHKNDAYYNEVVTPSSKNQSINADFKNMTNDEIVDYCLKIYGDGEEDKAKNLIEQADSISRTKFFHTIKENNWF